MTSNWTPGNLVRGRTSGRVYLLINVLQESIQDFPAICDNYSKWKALGVYGNMFHELVENDEYYEVIQ